MPWHARFRRWLDRWLGDTRDASRDDAPKRDEASAGPPAAPVERRSSAVWTPAPAAMRAPLRHRDTRPLRLALQGGGAHGAFTWGVLDRLLDEEHLVFPLISGASAGALNGAMLVSGAVDGGRAGAQRALAGLWDGIARIGALIAPLQAQQKLAADLGLVHVEMMQAMMRMLAPTQLNPFNLNPLRTLLEDLVDVEALRSNGSMRLHVSATEVETGQPHIFTGSDLSIDALLASACLPLLNHAVAIDGVAYWDGGYSANPALAPLIDEAAGAEPGEILLVQINPQRRPGVPSSASDILHRINEITFNASLLAELRAFEAAQTKAAPGATAGSRNPPRVHRIALHDEVDDATLASAASLDGVFHRELRDRGRKAAERWLGAPSPADHKAPSS